MIISAFPATGKSYIFGNHKTIPSLEGLTFGDSDSSTFDKDEFPQNYLEHILKRKDEVDVLFVSTHASVRRAMLDAGLTFVQVMPDPALKAQYLERCRLRGSPDAMISFLDTNWDSFFDDGHTPEKVVTLTEGQYLLDVLQTLRAEA